MTKTNRKLLSIALGVVVTAFVSNAHATLIGATVNGSITGQTLSSSCTNAGARTVGAAIEYGCDNGVLRWEADIGEDYVELTITNMSVIGANIGNDAAIHLEFAGYLISDVYLNPNTNRSYSSFSGGTLDIDFPAATPDVEVFRWSIVAQQQTVVPEPSGTGLVAAGLLALIFVRRRRPI